MKRTLRLVTGAAILLIYNLNSALAQVPDSCTFVQSGDLVAVEMESTNTNGTFWAKQADIPGYSGSGYIEYTGGDATGSPGISKISYTYRITSPGTYSFKMRGYRSSYHSNDVWVRFPHGEVSTRIGTTVTGSKGSDWFKAMIGPSNQWFYFVTTQNLATHGEQQHQIFVDFPAAGVYTVEFSGRAPGFKVDRFTLHKSGTPDGMNPIVAESATENCLPYSNASDYPYVANPLVDQNVNSGNTWTYTIPSNTFTHPGGMTLNYAVYLNNVQPLPSWMTYNAGTKTFTGTPAYADGGVYTIIVKAQDANEKYAIDAFELDVAGNEPPVIANQLKDSVANTGESFLYAIPSNTFSDANGDPLTITVRSQLGVNTFRPWLTYDPVTMTFTGNPTTADIGNDTIYVDATDGYVTVTERFLIFVKSLTVQGVKNKSNAMKVSVFPNPADEKITIQMEANGTGTLTLLDNTGKVQYHEENLDLNKELSLNLSSLNLNSGFYILKIKSTTDNKEYNGIFIKK